jgi:hypothetical protein
MGRPIPNGRCCVLIEEFGKNRRRTASFGTVETGMTAEVVDAIPLSKDAHGVYRVGGTRVTLDLVVRSFNRGATPEEIAQAFPSLQLADIYQIIGY